jgi:hypothetical protein
VDFKKEREENVVFAMSIVPLIQFLVDLRIKM